MLLGHDIGVRWEQGTGRLSTPTTLSAVTRTPWARRSRQADLAAAGATRLGIVPFATTGMRSALLATAVYHVSGCPATLYLFLFSWTDRM